MRYPWGNITMSVLCSILGLALLTGCSGYKLMITDAEVTDLTDTRVSYRVSVKNSNSTSTMCKPQSFHGYFAVQAFLTDQPDLDSATIKEGAGGFGEEYMIPMENATTDKRTIAVGQEFTADFGYTLESNFSIGRTPYIIFTLSSSTESRPTKSGTKGCTRYGNHFVVDLREIDTD